MGGSGKRAGLGSVDKVLLSGTTERPSLKIRWESAEPVRAAELKAGETDAPAWDGNYYAIAVYDVPGITPASQKSLRGELKQTTFLKRMGKKDVKPADVEVALLGKDVARILYLFPRAAVLTVDDRQIEFVSQIGRIVVSQFFDTGDMQFQGKLGL